MKYIFIIQCLGLKCNLIYLLDFGRFNTLYAISFWLQKAKKDTAAIVNAGLGIGTFLPVRTDSSGRATEKVLSPRGYERKEIIQCLVGKTKHFPMILNTKIKNHPLLFPRFNGVLWTSGGQGRLRKI